MLQPGTEVAGYRVEGFVGHGGMSIVYEATQLSLNRTVALKLITPQLGLDASFRERFRREGQIQAAIDHPNILPIFEAGEVEEGLFLAVRLVRGGTLKDLIVARELEGARTVRLLRPIADALDTAHGAGLIHRDIKPQNILVERGDRPYLADFGLTKGVEDKGLTRTGQFVGTTDYISPEQIRGEQATAASDLYAFGAVLYECLTGLVPFPRVSDAAVLYAHMTEPPPRVTDERPDLPAPLDDVVSKAMDKNPASRHESAGDLVEAAERAFGRRVRAVITPPPPVEVPEQTGIRDAEGKIPTRESRVRPLPPIDGLSATRPQHPEKTDDSLASPRASSPPAAEPTPATTPTEEVQPEGHTFDETVETVPPVESPQEASPQPQRAEMRRGDRTPATAAGPTVSPTAGGRPELAGGGTAAAVTIARPPRGATKAAVAGQESADGVDARGMVRAPAALLAIAAGVLVLLGIGGYVLGHSGSDEQRPAVLAQRALSPALSMRVPRTWHPTSIPRALSGLSIQQGLSRAPGRAPTSSITAGMTTATGATLLPPAFLTGLPGPPSTDDRVRLGRLAAYRYQGLRPRGSAQDLTVYVVPTTEGVLTVACSAPADATAFMRDCERVAGTIQLARGRAFPLEPNPAYARTLGRTVGALNRARAHGLAGLSHARRPAAQAVAAAALARSYGVAARSLARQPISPAVQPANAAILASFRAGRDAYAQLSAAARARRSRAYAVAGVRVAASERAVRRAVARLEALGYVTTGPK